MLALASLVVYVKIQKARNQFAIRQSQWTLLCGCWDADTYSVRRSHKRPGTPPTAASEPPPPGSPPESPRPPLNHRVVNGSSACFYALFVVYTRSGTWHVAHYLSATQTQTGTEAEAVAFIFCKDFECIYHITTTSRQRCIIIVPGLRQV